jgi:hypothetical protein
MFKILFDKVTILKVNLNESQGHLQFLKSICEISYINEFESGD